MFGVGTTLPGGVASTSCSCLISEAVSFLNGAHLNPRGQLSNLFRRYHQTLTATPSKNGGSPVETTPSLSSVVLSELGVNHLSEQQLSQALANSWTSLNSHSVGDAITVNDVLKQCRGQLRGIHVPHHQRSRTRLFSSHPLPSLSPNSLRVPFPFTNSQLSPLSLIQRRGYVSVMQLEDRANSEIDNPQAQSRYLAAVVEDDPQYVVRRFESGRYAVDSESRKIYQRALELVEKSKRGEGLKSQPLGSIFSTMSIGSRGEANAGSRDNPIHVVNVPRRMGILRELWTLARFLIIAFVVVSLVSSALITPMKTGTQHMTKEFRPDPGEKRYTFDDVQGVDEAKSEVQETVEFLKNPEKFQRLGAKLPTGLLLIGPPGTGKTLLAKAIAGEAEVPFFFASGSEFDEMFVGVGAARVRKLFEQARRHKPCVVFIDELDAVGGARVASSVHPYSRMTLNQLLVEMDGYKELEGIVIIGATNFPESLDKALIRPGRFDSRINIPLPDVKARLDILQVHAKKVKMNEGVDLEVVARGTPGFSGADLANLINQAALRGSALGREAVIHEDLDFAKDKIIMGPERRSAVIEEKNRRLVAYHEGGHAIVALFTADSLPVYKATIMPRGQALGMVTQLPEKDELSWSKKQLLARMDVAMGGRVAEEIIFGVENITTGASSDLEHATRIATNMVTKFGMTESVGLVAHNEDKTSSATKKLVDDEVKRLLKESHDRAHAILKSRSVEHKRLAEALLKYETLSLDEIKLVIAGKQLHRKI